MCTYARTHPAPQVTTWDSVDGRGQSSRLAEQCRGASNACTRTRAVPHHANNTLVHTHARRGPAPATHVAGHGRPLVTHCWHFMNRAEPPLATISVASLKVHDGGAARVTPQLEHLDGRKAGAATRAGLAASAPAAGAGLAASAGSVAGLVGLGGMTSIRGASMPAACSLLVQVVAGVPVLLGANAPTGRACAHNVCEWPGAVASIERRRPPCRAFARQRRCVPIVEASWRGRHAQCAGATANIPCCDGRTGLSMSPPASKSLVSVLLAYAATTRQSARV